MPAIFDPKSTFQGSGTYRIQVRGQLDPEWEDRLGGMRLTPGSDTDDHPNTTLTGTLRDQAELMGVLNTLYELRLPILSVEHRNSGSPPLGTDSGKGTTGTTSNPQS